MKKNYSDQIKESLSALIDNEEVSELELRRVLNSMDDPEFREHAKKYQLIKDALHRTRSDFVNTDLSDRIKAQIDIEPQLNKQKDKIQKIKKKFSLHNFRRAAIGMSIAATILFVVREWDSNFFERQWSNISYDTKNVPVVSVDKNSAREFLASSSGEFSGLESEKNEANHQLFLIQNQERFKSYALDREEILEENNTQSMMSVVRSFVIQSR